MTLPCLFLLLLGSSMAQAAADFSRPGPCAPQSWQPDFPVPSDLQAVQLPAKLRLNVTMPDCPATAEQAFGPAPSPVLFFFNGFMVSSRSRRLQAPARLGRVPPPRRRRSSRCQPLTSPLQNRAGWYHRLMQRAASWGLVTVQYDTPFFPLLTVAAEVQLFPYLLQVRLLLPSRRCCCLNLSALLLHQAPLLCLQTSAVNAGMQWVADQGDDPASPLYGRADMASVAVGGHSRGGKLATLAFTGRPPVSTCRWCGLPPLPPLVPLWLCRATTATFLSLPPPHLVLLLTPTHRVAPPAAPAAPAGNPQLVQAAYLVDPVDVTRWSPESADNPSGGRRAWDGGRRKRRGAPPPPGQACLDVQACRGSECGPLSRCWCKCLDAGTSSPERQPSTSLLFSSRLQRCGRWRPAAWQWA